MFNRYKIFAAYLLAIPLALILGILAASPGEMTFMLVGMLLFFLTLPLFFTWHHTLLIVFWNSAFSAYFLPGQPNFWLVFAAISFGLSGLNYVMGRRPFLRVPEMTRPILFIIGVVAFTAFYRGGLGFQVLGGANHGSKYYIYLLGAAMGYFALTAGQVPMAKSRKMASIFFLSGTTAILSNLAYVLGPAFYFFYYLVPSSLAGGQAASDLGLTSIDRISGLGSACPALLCFLLVNYGIRGLFEWSKPWRFVLLIVTVGASFFGGYRSTLALLFLIFAFQFYFEGLLRTRLCLVMIGLAVLGFIVVANYGSRMPLAMQRAMSFLPIKVDSGVQADAEATTEWRYQMWAIVWRDVPKYLLVGKGYSFDAAEMDLTKQAIEMGILSNMEESMLAGDYHSGPLTVLIPFGIMGVVGFLWLLIACFRVLYLNYRYGDEELRLVNCVLLSYFAASGVSFILVFGSFSNQLYSFLGTVGLGVCLNGGVRRKQKAMPEYGRSSLEQAVAVELS